MPANPFIASPRHGIRRGPLHWRSALLVILFFGGLSALFYAPILLGLRTFPDGDFTHHFLPFSLFQQQELLSGRLPVWNPYTYSGHPFLADVQAAVFYPLSNLLLAMTLPWNGAGARLYFLQVEAVVHVALAGIFTYLLAYALTRSRWAGLLAGLLFAFSGYLTGYPPVQLAVLRTAIWLPLLLWLLLQAVTSPGQMRWWMASSITAVVAFLAGHSQTFLFLAYAAAAWIVLLVAARWRAATRREQQQLALGLAAGALAAAGLSAAQLLPSVEFAQLSVRANVAYDFVAGGFPLQDTWQMLLPGVLTYYSPLYIGVAGLGLAWMGIWVALHDLPKQNAGGRWMLALRTGAAYFLGLAAVALLLAYGSSGFLYPLFYRWAPGWNLFRGQERAAYLVALGLSLLAGYGALAIQAMPQRARSLWATSFAAVTIGATYLFGLLRQLPGHTVVGQTHFLLLAALTVAAASLFAGLLRAPGWSRRRWLWLTALAAAALFAANLPTNLSEFGPAQKVLLAPEVEAVQTAVMASAGSSGPAGRVYNEFRVYEDYGMRAGIEDVWGASPLRIARYAALFDQFPLDRMWRLLSVEHVLTWRKELFGPSQLLAEFPQATDTTYLHRLPGRQPRAWMASAVRPANDEEALQLLADHQFDLNTTAVLASSAQNNDVQMLGDPAVAAAEVTVERRSPGHLHITVRNSLGGLLVAAENWMPGWRVQGVTCLSDCIDIAPLGLPAFEPLRADLTLIGIPIPPGAYSFNLVYQPDSISNGLWISGSTLALLALLGLWRWWSSRKGAA